MDNIESQTSAVQNTSEEKQAPTKNAENCIGDEKAPCSTQIVSDTEKKRQEEPSSDLSTVCNSSLASPSPETSPAGSIKTRASKRVMPGVPPKVHVKMKSINTYVFKPSKRKPRPPARRPTTVGYIEPSTPTKKKAVSPKQHASHSPKINKTGTPASSKRPSVKGDSPKMQTTARVSIFTSVSPMQLPVHVALADQPMTEKQKQSPHVQVLLSNKSKAIEWAYRNGEFRAKSRHHNSIARQSTSAKKEETSASKTSETPKKRKGTSKTKRVAKATNACSKKPRYTPQSEPVVKPPTKSNPPRTLWKEFMGGWTTPGDDT